MDAAELGAAKWLSALSYVATKVTTAGRTVKRPGNPSPPPWTRRWRRRGGWRRRPTWALYVFARPVDTEARKSGRGVWIRPTWAKAPWPAERPAVQELRRPHLATRFYPGERGSLSGRGPVGLALHSRERAFCVKSGHAHERASWMTIARTPSEPNAPPRKSQALRQLKKRSNNGPDSQSHRAYRPPCSCSQYEHRTQYTDYAGRSLAVAEPHQGSRLGCLQPYGKPSSTCRGTSLRLSLASHSGYLLHERS